MDFKFLAKLHTALLEGSMAPVPSSDIAGQLLSMPLTPALPLDPQSFCFWKEEPLLHTLNF